MFLSGSTTKHFGDIMSQICKNEQYGAYNKLREVLRLNLSFVYLIFESFDKEEPHSLSEQIDGRRPFDYHALFLLFFHSLLKNTASPFKLVF